MKKHCFAILFAMLPITGMAQTTTNTTDGYVMGAGQWTCAEVIRVVDAGTPIEKGQLFGWIMGYWSAVTFRREEGFIDIVEQVGGLGISNATHARCKEAPEDALLYRVVQSMIINTNQ